MIKPHIFSHMWCTTFMLAVPFGGTPLLSFLHTVNIDIFACINCRGFMKIDNFAWIKIRVFSTNDSLGYNDSNFHSVYIFADI